MPKKFSRFVHKEQPISWSRAFFAGVGGVSVMMMFMDIFYMLGLNHFSFELYLGTLILHGTHYLVSPGSWVMGVMANWVLGGIFGFFYAFTFEYYYRVANAKLGAVLGLVHLVAAGFVLFPLVNTFHSVIGSDLYPRFGLFGYSLNHFTPLFLIGGHMLFGATTGMFYGPVRIERVRAREFEPGESGAVGEPDVITEEEDPEDRVAV